MDEGNNRARGTGNNKRRKRKNNGGARILFVCFCALLALISFGVWAAYKYMPNKTEIDFYDYYAGLKKESVHLIFPPDGAEEPDGPPVYVNTELIGNISKNHVQIVLGEDIILSDHYPVINDIGIYMPVDFMKEFPGPHLYWDEAADKLTITTEYKLMRMNPDDLTYEENMTPMSLNHPVYNIEGAAYIPESMIDELYHLSLRYEEDYGFVVVDPLEKDQRTGVVTGKNARMRYEPHIKSPVAAVLSPGEALTVYGEAEENFVKVRLDNGLIGYVALKDMAYGEIIPGYEKEQEQSLAMVRRPIQGKINMLWDLITVPGANNTENAREVHPGLDVLSPTWFMFDRETYNGDMLTLADMSYVNWAHSNGYQVWAMLKDEEDAQITSLILSDTEKREYAIQQLLAYISFYKLDGINIDFERVDRGDIDYFHQFLRELSPMLKAQGVVLSVDTFVPSDYSLYYDRAELARVSDYICVMTYDEYTSTTGPNASIGFVEQGVTDTLREVPSEKLIMCLPYYARMWTERVEDGEVTYKKRSLGMNYSYRMFIENGAEFQWQADMGAYYGEYDTTDEDGFPVTCKIWLEDERSLGEKLKLVDKYNLAGVAGWVRGLEKEEVWDLLASYLK